MQFLVLALVPVAALIILIILITKVQTQSARINNLEWEINKLHGLDRHIAELSAYIDALKQEIEDLKLPGSRRKREPAPASAVPSEQVGVMTAEPTPLAIAAIPIPPPKPFEPPTPSRTREEWEALIGGKLLNRIGALALIIGIGMFLKYAFDNNWFTETMRVLIGAAIGLLCVGGGYRTHKRGFQIFAQGLVGAGISILYLSVYAAFNFYHLVPQWFAFVLMSVVTVTAFANGLFYDSLAEAILGWAGGFLTPLMLSTGQANEVGLFSYIAILDIGLIAIVIRKERWYVLEPLTLVATWVMYLLWRDPYYTDADLWITVFFVTVFWLLFLVLDVVRSRKSSQRDALDQIVPGVNALFYFLALYFLLNKDNHAWMGFVTLTLGVAYFSLYLALQRREGLSLNVKKRYTLTAAALTVIATAIQFYDFDTVMFWSVEAAVLLWCSREWKVQFVQTAGLVVFGLAVFKLIFVTETALMYSPIREFAPLLNHRSAAFAVVAGMVGYSATMVNPNEGDDQKTISSTLHVAWCILVFILLTAETYDFFRYRMLDLSDDVQQQLAYFRMMTYGVVWVTFSLPLLWVGLRQKLLPLIISGLVCALLAVVFGAVRGIAFDPIDNYTPVYNVRSIALILLATGLLLQTQYIQKSGDAFGWLKDIRGYIQVAIVVVIFVLLTGETRDFFERDIVAMSHIHQEGISTELNRLSNLQQMSLSGIWLLYSGVLMTVGIWRKFRGMRFAAIVLFGITILKIFVYDLSFLDTLYRIFSFLALGLILLAVSYAYQKYKDVIIGKT